MALRLVVVGLLAGLLAVAAGAGCGIGIITGPEPGTGAVEGGADASAVVDLAVPPPVDAATGPVDLTQPDLGFDVEPHTLQTVTVTAGQTMPTVAFNATLAAQAIAVGWSIDRGEIGTIGEGPSSGTTFAPRGTTGGLVNVLAGLNGTTLQRQVMVQLVAQQNGANPAIPAEAAQMPSMTAQLTAGGGVGGVGGEGLGPAVTDLATLLALEAPKGDPKAQNLHFLYPYDQTIWPRGLLAPLLMWDWMMGDADAIQIQLQTISGSFTYTGNFGRPAILAQTGGAFVRHPIPEDIWEMATNSAGATLPNGKPDQLLLSVLVARGGVAYGPITQTWSIAPARLSGIIYYNSYGTQLAKNYGGAVGGDKQFGGAVLSIHVGDTGPQLAAGSNAECRVCHSVAANGSRLIVQHGDNYGVSSDYDLSPNGSVEHVLGIEASQAGIYPDGSKVLTEAGQLLPLPNDSAPLAVSGLSTVVSDLGNPAFSPDGTLVVFNPASGPGLANPNQKLMVMKFDPVKLVFSNPLLIADDTGQPAQTRPGWPAFFPDSHSVVFQHQSVAGLDGNAPGTLYTRKGCKAQIAWSNALAGPGITPLDQLNGKDAAGNVYLPKLAVPSTVTCTADGAQVGQIDNDHGDDVDLNYEPTVNPVASGGYAWVVFTSRRLYGNEAVIPPFCSDPRGVDLIKNITTKKLWVAAVDLNAKAGTDASHPAFYLPGQELLAGNARGFWVLDPCKPDGQSCDTGDQCCNGYCEPGGDGGLECTNQPPNHQCSAPEEKCATSADCCDPTNQCIDGFCAQTIG